MFSWTYYQELIKNRIFKKYEYKLFFSVLLKLSNNEIFALIISDDLPYRGHYLSSSITVTNDLYTKLSRLDIVEFNLGHINVVVK